ncbi:hypothetical protein Syun_021230 [Stephania yunnanensis]|uniref:Uncharacterized protein n=1 Tax=Stephania yunnanensis TaxID=152371 RepID=A0AAP0IFE9_9MAGN
MRQQRRWRGGAASIGRRNGDDVVEIREMVHIEPRAHKGQEWKSRQMKVHPHLL